MTSRQREAVSGITCPISAGDFGKLVEMELAEELGAGRFGYCRFKDLGESLVIVK